MKLKKGDEVLVLSGKDAGKKGKILKVMPEDMTIVVEGINMAKKHKKPTQKFQGGIIDQPMPVPSARVQILCPRCGKAARIGRKEGLRYCKKCKEVIDKA